MNRRRLSRRSLKGEGGRSEGRIAVFLNLVARLDVIHCVPNDSRAGNPSDLRWRVSCVQPCMARDEKRFVYVIRSDADPSRHYTGVTSDVAARLKWHNHGPCGYPINNRPWSLVVAMEFSSEAAARRFEKYLKSGSGRAFAKRHFGGA